MQKPKIPSNENQRLKDLESYQLLTIQESKDFDFITEMAAEICGTKISLISLVLEGKQWFLSHHGLAVQETSRDYSFCAHAINSPEHPLLVEDARLDDRFSDNPLTSGFPNVIFYAGIPLLSKSGTALGTLCVIDDHPKVLSEAQLNKLKRLANQTMQLFELRRSKLELTEVNAELQKKIELFEETELANNIGSWELDIKSGQTKWTETVYKIHEVDLDFDHNKHNGIEFYHPDYRKIIIDALTDCIAHDKRFDVTCILITAKGNHRWVRSTGRKLGEKVIGSFQDITDIKKSELKFKGIFNSTFSFIGFLDVHGVLLEANDTAVNMAGIKHSDVIGKYFWDCYWWQISAKTRQELKNNFERVLQGETVVYEVEVWIANETPFTILFSMKPIFDDAGNVVFVIPEGRPVQDIIEVRNRYSAVLEATQAGTFEWNIETDEVVINDRFAEILGYKVEELQPITFDKWVVNAFEEDLFKAGEVIKQCFKGELEFFELEMRMTHKGGNYVWVNVRGKIFEWSSEGKAMKMYGTMIEISKRKNAELKLLEERSLLRTIIDSSPDSIYVKDLEGRKIIANKADVALCGASTEEDVLGKTDEEIFPPEVSKGTSQIEERVLVRGESILNEEGVLTDKDGNQVWLLTSKFPMYDQEGKISGLVGMGRNITKRKNAEQDLIYSRSLLEALYILSPIGIALNDFETGKFLDGNQKLLEPTGYTKEEFETLSYFDVTPKEYEPLEIKALEQMKSKGAYDLFEKEYIRKDGTRYPVALQGVVVEDTRGEKLIWSFIRDISEEKKAESEIKSLLDITQDQNRRLMNFAHIVSHNLRSHSSGISGLLDIFLHENPKLKENELLRLVHQGANNLMQTVEDLTEVVNINLSKKEKTSINLKRIVQKNLDSLAAQISLSKVKVQNLVDGEIEIEGITAYLDSITLNFITNAIKYRSSERSATLDILTEVTEDKVILLFKDNGQGIDLEKYGDQLFGMYKTFHDHDDSRGVGLFITKNQIESMGGTIEVESTVGVGTTFKIILPYEKN